ncbi:hypothetical protein A8F94_01070 [Bacillus sp. FJAT-27225]|uniref:hypothetical protein n=1 Tax=Bacillus sp. FJAT-27225 TaxID=1743144 RepID=UPI00080C2D74|nr:hypothetical protein [Bacillus sp. FJAT-27225]OCA90508.1 hypothetical protein A8F94_01070 [Bacillus sp. FJAT-27225]
MKWNEKVKDDNYKVFALLSNYLNHVPDFVRKVEVEEIVQGGLTYEYAFAVILAAGFGLDIIDNNDDKDLFNAYFREMFHRLDTHDFYTNPYYKNIQIPTIKLGTSELKYDKFKAFEGFVCDDIVLTKEGRQIPQIGFFDTDFEFPAVLENGRIWMTVTPNEIETMKEPIDEASGHVLTYGLGLGYFTYMVSEKEQVESVTVVEMNEDVIQLFTTYILPQFKHANKVKIIKSEAFDYAEKQMPAVNYDFVFTDLWHDVSDGLDMYIKMKKYEAACRNSKFSYWIEKSILCYLE